MQEPPPPLPPDPSPPSREPEIIPVGPALAPPRLPGRVVMRDSADVAIDAMLADMYIHATNCVRAFGDFQFAVSATPESEAALMRLMYDPSFREFPWGRTRLWMVDEVDVPPEDPRHRATRLTETIIACSGIPENQCHLLGFSPGLGEYEKLLREHLGWREKGHDRLDFILLTLDEAGRLAVLDEAHHDSEALKSLALPLAYFQSARLISIYAGEVKRPEVLVHTTRCGRGLRGV